MDQGGDDADFLGRHAVEPVDPYPGLFKCGRFGNFPGQKVKEAPFVGEVILQVPVVGTVKEGKVSHFPSQRRISLGFGGGGKVLFRHAEHVELVEEAGELFRKMGMGSGLHHHPEFVLVLFHEPPDDDLLP